LLRVPTRFLAIYSSLRTVASDLPMIEPVMVEVPNPGHPYGAKGAAEVNICPPMAAIANAIERATGRRLTELPMSPPRVLAAIDAVGPT
jgi:CO/xanthine dehydrogenase Mo-binding subunit